MFASFNNFSALDLLWFKLWKVSPQESVHSGRVSTVGVGIYFSCCVKSTNCNSYENLTNPSSFGGAFHWNDISFVGFDSQTVTVLSSTSDNRIKTFNWAIKLREICLVKVTVELQKEEIHSFDEYRIQKWEKRN